MTTMRVVEIRKPGGPEVLEFGSRPRPVPAAGEVLIQVRAAGVNRPDLLQRAGLYPPPPGASDIPGLEVAGTVVALGDGVTAPARGAEVCALVSGGGYAEYCVAPAGQCLPVPSGLSAVEAASLPETYFTVWSNVFDRARLAPGESILVQGGASGIGTTAIQMASALGSRVFATAGTPEKCAACESLGADVGICYRTQDFVDVVLQATDGLGVNVVLDMVAGDYVPREIKCLRDEGRLVFIAFQGGPQASFNVMEVMRKRITITGSTLRPRPIAFKAAIARALEERVWPLLSSKRIKPVVFRTFPLAEAADAHRLLEAGEHIGKLVLTV